MVLGCSIGRRGVCRDRKSQGILLFIIHLSCKYGDVRHGQVVKGRNRNEDSHEFYTNETVILNFEIVSFS